MQVGTIGLIKAVDRFDTDRGVEFSTYATPTVIGEIKRHFRDKGWAIRVPRRLQELRMQIGGATGELTQTLGRSPTPRELAEVIGCSVEEIMEGIESSHAYATLSLDASDDSDDGPPAMLATLGVEDADLEHVEIRESIKPLLEGLGEREKKILLLRFFKNMTQSQIAEEIGVSQMHVSRLLTRTLGAAADLARAGLALGLVLQRAGARRVQEPDDRRRAPPRPVPAETGFVEPAHRFHASPSWMSWAITTGPLRPAARVLHSDQAHHASAAAATRKNADVRETHRQPCRAQVGELQDAQRGEHERLERGQRGRHHEGRRSRVVRNSRRNRHSATLVVTDDDLGGGLCERSSLASLVAALAVRPGPLNVRKQPSACERKRESPTHGLAQPLCLPRRGP